MIETDLRHRLHPHRSTVKHRAAVGPTRFGAAQRMATWQAVLADCSTVRGEVLAGTGLVPVGELTGGLRFGMPRSIETLVDGTCRVLNTMAYSEAQIERIARAAAACARWTS